MEKNNMGYDRIGNEYLLLKKLGEGGYATVYKVKNLEYGYIRAIRVLNTHVESEQEKVYKNFLRECRVLLRLGNGCHPNIVRLYQPRHVAGRAFVEMDWVDGEDLRQLIDRYGGKVPVEETLRMVREIGSALAYCHHDIYKVCYDRESDQLEDADDGTALITPEIEQRLVEKYRVIHNDIHTGNIMRRRDGEYVLLDFGLAVDGDSDVVNSSRRQQGAIEFLSPERLDGQPPTPQDDIYGFGCVLYAMLTGRPPFPMKREGKEVSYTEQMRVFMAHKETPPPPIERTDVPGWLKEMTMRCLVKNPQERYADGYELYQEVQKHVAEMSTEVSAVLASTVQELTKKIKDLERKLDEKPKATVDLVSLFMTPMSSTSVDDHITFTAGGESFAMVGVEGGTFTMGCTSEQGGDCYGDESPAHSVTLSSYYIGETEVTQALWRAVMGNNPSYFKGYNLPVEQVSWMDVQGFIEELNRLTGRTFRLPTEAEWEYAARGGSKSRGYKYSGSNSIDAVAWYEDNSGNKTHAVKGKLANELGLYDMSGNVWEWCLDWKGDYSSGSQRDPGGPTTGSHRVLRGGCWDSIARLCRVSNRACRTPDNRGYYYGFRLVLCP